MFKKIMIISFLINFILLSHGMDKVVIKTFFSEKEIEQVLSGEIITRMYLKHNAVDENTDLEIKIPHTKYTDGDFNIYEMITDEKAFIPYKLTNESELKLYNALLSFSKLKGMKYWNRGDERAMQFILDCYRIESPKKKDKTGDQLNNFISPKMENYFVQKDNKFGTLTYKSELFHEGNNFILVNTCIQPIVKFIAINKKNEYKIITFFIYDEEKEGYFYYVLNVMRIRLDLLLRSGKLYPGTFSNRLRGATVHLVNLLNIDWFDKINPWDEKKLRNGYYKNY